MDYDQATYGGKLIRSSTYTPLVLGKLARGVSSEELTWKRAIKYLGPYSEATAMMFGGKAADACEHSSAGGD